MQRKHHWTSNQEAWALSIQIITKHLRLARRCLQQARSLPHGASILIGETVDEQTNTCLRSLQMMTASRVMGQMMAEQVSLSRGEGGTKEGLSEEVTLEL